MMREIKYRCFDSHTQKMGDVMNMSLNDDGIIGAVVDFGGNDAQGVLAEQCHFLQYTGREDREGKALFHGDVVVAPDANDRGDGSFDEGIGVIFYSNASLQWEVWFDEGHNALMSEWAYEDEIKTELTLVGNIYKDIELKDFARLEPKHPIR